jgi:chromosomal replication initiation ATPase DnaA
LGVQTVMDLWSQILSLVKARVSRQCYDTWFLPIQFVSVDESTLSLRVPSESFRKWLQESHGATLQETAREASQKPLRIQFSVPQEEAVLLPPAAAPPPARRAFH